MAGKTSILRVRKYSLLSILLQLSKSHPPVSANLGKLFRMTAMNLPGSSTIASSMLFTSNRSIRYLSPFPDDLTRAARRMKIGARWQASYFFYDLQG